MPLTRRSLLRSALAMPCAGAFFPHFNALAAPARGQVKITAIKAMQTRSQRTLIRIDTDAGVWGIGETGTPGSFARDVIAGLEGPRLPHLGLIGKDPLAIQVHFHNMFYAYPQRGRTVRVLSGIDIALWDLAGKLLGKPVSKLLGGNFRDEIPLYSHSGTRDPLSKQSWAETAAMHRADPKGFQAFKVDIHHPLGIPMQEYTPSIGPRDVRKVEQYYALAREAFGPEIDIIVHCHAELDVASAIRVAQVIEPIRPLFYEDPLAPGFSESWMALRRATRVAVMTGEALELLDGALPFLQNQAVDCLQPDLINSGGITGVRMIAEMAAVYRTPVCLHNVSGLVLAMASQQWSAAVFNCPRMECVRGDQQLRGVVSNAPVIRGGKMKVSTLPGLGVDLDPEFLKGDRMPGEPWWA